jgi:hypothetical protein
LPTAYRSEWESAGRSFVILAGIAWKMLMESFDTAARDLEPERLSTIRYEDFLKTPLDSLRTIADFLELPWSSRFAAALKQRPLDCTRLQAFEHDLTIAQRGELDHCLAPLLARYGYQV